MWENYVGKELYCRHYLGCENVSKWFSRSFNSFAYFFSRTLLGTCFPILRSQPSPLWHAHEQAILRILIRVLLLLFRATPSPLTSRPPSSPCRVIVKYAHDNLPETLTHKSSLFQPEYRKKIRKKKLSSIVSHIMKALIRTRCLLGFVFFSALSFLLSKHCPSSSSSSSLFVHR